VASSEARALSREGAPAAAGVSALVEAGVQSVKGDRDGAALRLREAIAELEVRDAKLHVDCARLALGRMLGGDEGERLVARATKELSDQGVRMPEKLARLFVVVDERVSGAERASSSSG
jgi:hypothetical protein